MDIIRTLGVFLVYKKKGLIKMEMNELQTLRHSASHILAQAVKRSEERRVGKEGRSRWSPDH